VEGEPATGVEAGRTRGATVGGGRGVTSHNYERREGESVALCKSSKESFRFFCLLLFNAQTDTRERCTHSDIVITTTSSQSPLFLPIFPIQFYFLFVLQFFR